MTTQERTAVLPKSENQTARPGLGLALLVIAAAQFMVVLDGTIVNVALPSIQNALNLAETDLNWIISTYALAFGGLLLVGGRAGDLFGRRRVFRIGLVVFALASLLGGLATDMTLLLTGRALQGVGAALAAPTALSLLATTFPAGPQRNKALGVYGSMAGLGAVGGLLLGGALTDYVSWRWVLLVNIPIAVAVLLGTKVLVEGGRERGGVDVSGAITVTLGLGALVYAINRANTDGWSDGVAIGFFVAAAVLLAAFLVIQRRGAFPMVPARVLRDRARAGAYIIMFLVGAAMIGTFYFLTLYMQAVKGYSPMLTGFAYMPFAVGIVVGAGWFGPTLLARFSERAVTLIGLLVAAGGTAWFGILTPDQNPWVALLPAGLVAGAGMGLVLVAATIVAVRGVEANDTGIASGLVNTGQQIGGALGLAVMVTIATAVTSGKLSSLAVREAVTDGYATGLVVAGGIYLVALVVGALTINVPRPDAVHAGR